MAKTEAAPAPTAAVTIDLGDFEGRPVARTSIAITSAGDGLSDALKVDPVLLHHGDKVFVVLETVVAQVNHVPLDGDGQELVRKHSLKTTGATIVDESLVSEVLEEQATKIRKAREEAEGIQSLFDEEQAEAEEAAQAEREAAESRDSE